MNVVDCRWSCKVSVTVLSEFRGEGSLFPSRCPGGNLGKKADLQGFRCVEVMALNSVILYYFSLRSTVILSSSVTWTSVALPVPFCILSAGDSNLCFTDEGLGFSLST